MRHHRMFIFLVTAVCFLFCFAIPAKAETLDDFVQQSKAFLTALQQSYDLNGHTLPKETVISYVKAHYGANMTVKPYSEPALLALAEKGALGESAGDIMSPAMIPTIDDYLAVAALYPTAFTADQIQKLQDYKTFLESQAVEVDAGGMTVDGPAVYEPAESGYYVFYSKSTYYRCRTPVCTASNASSFYGHIQKMVNKSAGIIVGIVPWGGDWTDENDHCCHLKTGTPPSSGTPPPSSTSKPKTSGSK